MKTVNDFNFKDKKAIIRVDFNVPLDSNGKITDDTRIQAAAPTVKKILGDGGSAILMSHLGRPKGLTPEFSLLHIKDAVAKTMGAPVKFAHDAIGPEVEKMAKELKSGEILLLENLRFHPEEEKGDAGFAKKLASLADIYVNDAFGTAHRAHASTAVIAQFFPNGKCFGLLMANEVEAINKVLKTGEKPVSAILGGSKVSSKLPIINKMLDSVNNLIIGGGMSFTFIYALGGKIGDSLLEKDYVDTAGQIMETAKKKGVNLYLPVDVVVADEFSENTKTQVCPVDAIPDGYMGMDVAGKTIEKFSKVVLGSRTILWNGPLGVFEMDKFSKGTRAIGDAIYEAGKKGAFSLVGGGDSVAAVKKFGYENKVSYVSTGGGAMLESLEGIVLPGVAAISE